MTKPTVLFVCVHNAGRSQMAAGYLRELGAGRIEGNDDFIKVFRPKGA